MGLLPLFCELLHRCTRYLCDESMDKRKVALDPSEWNITKLPQDVPQQRNMIDCGVFTCAFGDYVCRNKVRVCWASRGNAR